MKYNRRCWYKSSYKAIVLAVFILGFSCIAYAQTPGLLPDKRLPDKKLAPVLKAAKQRNLYQTFRVHVTSKASFENWVKQQLPSLQISDLKQTTNILVISEVNQKELNQLLDCPLVKFIDVPNRIPKEERAIDYLDLSANKITPVHARIPWLAGEGLAVSVKEQPFDATDIDFKGRVHNMGVLSASSTVHATTIATLIAGGGNSAPSGRGVARKSWLATSSFNELMPDNGQQLTENGISVQNHSYGVGVENYYGLEALAYDQHTNDYPDLLHVFSSGNAGEQVSTDGMYAGIAGFANLTGQFKMSKNTLTVGATDRLGQVAAQSSRGPAYDGRIKPEVTALGEGGTSEAAALVSGIGLLVQQAFKKENNGLLPSASLVKATIINSADDAGQPGIDFLSGFGSADGLGAINTILEKRFFTGSLAQDNEQAFNITIPPNIAQLKVTLVWHDEAAAPNAAQALVNDLGLALVHAATGRQWQPWVLNHYPHPDSLAQPAIRKADHLNNVEQITIQLPEPGNYKLLVKGYAVASRQQEFSLAYELLESGFNWIYPITGSTFQAGEPAIIRWQWPLSATPGKIEFKALGSEEWELIEEIDDLSQAYFTWIPPDTFTKGQFRLSADTVISISDTFAVADPLLLRVGYNCTEEAMLYWPKLPGVTQYQLYRLGETYLEPFMLIADTAVLLDKAQIQIPQYAVAPVSDGQAGEKSVTVDLTKQEIGCYVTSFLPRQMVTDTVFFDLSISTTSGLASVSLERWENGSFRTVQTISPITGLSIELADFSPDPGRNEYRVKLQPNKQLFFYSQTEPVYYMRKSDLLVFPNPVAEGQLLNIIEAEELTSVIRLYDNLGRLLYEAEESGAIKTIPSGVLKKGTYIVRVQTESGSMLSRRIVVF